MGLRFRLHLPLATVRAFHFRLRPGSAILDLAVRPAKVKAVDLAPSRRLEREKGSGRAVVPVLFEARSWPEFGRFFSAADFSDSQIGPVTADLVIAVGLSAVAADSDLAAVVAAGCSAVAVVVDLFAAALASGLVCFVCPVFSVCSVCYFAGGTEKGRAAVAFCFLIHRSSFLRSRNCLLPLCFEDRA